MELLLTGREWSELGSRDIDGKAERPSERARTSQWIGELGIYDYRHRMYNPDLGRFLQTDPTGFDAGDMNLFRYCDDDPVDRSDPTGLDWNYFPDREPRDFDHIPEISRKSDNGVTVRPVFDLKATVDPAPDGKGFVLHYKDVDIRSQSYIRTHQKNGYGSRPAQGDYPRSRSERDETKGHENRQKMIDKGLYDRWNRDGTFKQTVEDGKKYGDPDAAEKGRLQLQKDLKDRFEDARNRLGQQLQLRDGKYH
jgi:RHS repeat-associated protein